MKLKDKVSLIQSLLDQFFPNPTIPLLHRDPYTLLIAVILSAQSTDQRVNTITPYLFGKASTPEDMIKLSLDTLIDIIRPCGLGPTKAKAIQKLSSILLLSYQGRVPASLPDLEKLPGVGPKTAAVVVSQAFNQPAFPVDTHIYRCARRWGLSQAKSPNNVSSDLKHLFPKTKWIKLHLQMIYYARQYCPARRHIVTSCPICQAVTFSPP